MAGLRKFYLFFGFFYAVLLSIGSLVGFVLIRYTDFNAGYVINIVAFFLAIQLCVTRFGRGDDDDHHHDPAIVRSEIRRMAVALSVKIAIVALIVDLIVYAFASNFFTSEFAQVSVWRIAVIFCVYVSFAYIALTGLGSRERREQ